MLCVDGLAIIIELLLFGTTVLDTMLYSSKEFEYWINLHNFYADGLNEKDYARVRVEKLGSNGMNVEVVVLNETKKIT